LGVSGFVEGVYDRPVNTGDAPTDFDTATESAETVFVLWKVGVLCNERKDLDNDDLEAEEGSEGSIFDSARIPLVPQIYLHSLWAMVVWSCPRLSEAGVDDIIIAVGRYMSAGFGAAYSSLRKQ